MARADRRARRRAAAVDRGSSRLAGPGRRRRRRPARGRHLRRRRAGVRAARGRDVLLRHGSRRLAAHATDRPRDLRSRHHHHGWTVGSGARRRQLRAGRTRRRSRVRGAGRGIRPSGRHQRPRAAAPARHPSRRVERTHRPVPARLPSPARRPRLLRQRGDRGRERRRPGRAAGRQRRLPGARDGCDDGRRGFGLAQVHRRLDHRDAGGRAARHPSDGGGSHPRGEAVGLAGAQRSRCELLAAGAGTTRRIAGSSRRADRTA